eukprot:6255778-Ditylum_brightwellii.AAC.1
MVRHMKSIVYRLGPLVYKDQSSRHILFAMALDQLFLEVHDRTFACAVFQSGNACKISHVV